jgi:acyl-coenzyme A thioesterase PaaI-like protein
MATFDDATAVTARPDGTTFDVELDRGWTIGTGRPNGGYLLALLGRAALETARRAGAEQQHVIAASVQYVTSPSVGPAVVDTEVLRVGRSASQVRARLVQGEQVAVQAAFTVGHLRRDVDPYWGGVDPVTLPSEAECRPLPTPPGDDGDEPTFRQQVDERFDPSGLGFVDGAPGGRGELRTWFRFSDGREPDTLSLLFVVDALPPATFDVVSTGWVPTLDLTVYVRAVPAPGPLRVRFRTGLIQDGLADEVCEVWDSAGRLVAQSTQLVGIRIPDGPAG